MSNQIALSNDEIRAIAPSVFAEKPWSGVSSRYTFIPTIHAVEAIREAGFVPVRAAQSRVRVAGKKPFTKHMLRFRHKDDARATPKVVDGNAHHFYEKKNQPLFVEFVMTNSHDRSSAYCIDAGVYRQICSNGLVVSSGNFGSIHVYHSGNIVEDVLKATRDIIAYAPKMREQVTAWRAVAMEEKQKMVMAEAALINRYGLDDADNLLAPVAPESLLVIRRPEDKANDLWTVTNVIQENLMKGEVSGRSSSGRRVMTRAVTSVNTELDINRNVWSIAEVMAERLAK